MIRFLTALALLFAASSVAAAPAPADPVAAIVRTAPTWSDEFTTAPAAATWSRGYSPWRNTIGNRLLFGTNERQMYVDREYLGTDTLVMIGGTATLMARRMDQWTKARIEQRIAIEKPAKVYVDGIRKAGWMSALLKSEKSFGPYGYWEASIRWEPSAESWPAFWLLPKTWKWPPEIDIVEMILVNGAPTASMTVHTQQPGWVKKGCKVPIPNGGKGFHRYGLLWTKTTLTYYLDGKVSCVIPTPIDAHEPFYPILNLAMGGWAKEPTAATKDPQVMQVDYVRFWSQP